MKDCGAYTRRYARFWASFLGVFVFSVPVSGNSNAELPSGFPDGLVEELSFYLDAEAIDRKDEQVLGMKDRSGNQNDALLPDFRFRGEEGNPFLVPEATPSGKDAIGFSGVLGYLEVGANPDDFDGRAKTTLVVFRADFLEGGGTAGRITNTGYEILDSWADPEDQPMWRTRTNAMWANTGGALRVQNRNLDGGSIAVSTPGDVLMPGEFYVGVNQWRDNGDTVAALRNAENERFQNDTIGGVAVPEGHLFTRIGAGAQSGDAEGGATQFFDGAVAAVLVYNRELSQNELEEVEEYLFEVYFNKESDDTDLELQVTEGLSLHLSATDVVLDGEAITQMTDLSGRDNHAQSFIGEHPTPPEGTPTIVENATPSGRDAVRFHKADDIFFEIASNPDFDGPGKTTLAVFRPNALGRLDGGRIVQFSYNFRDGDNPAAGNLLHAHSVQTSGSDEVGQVRVENRSIDGSSVAVSSPGGTLTTLDFHIGGNHWRDDGQTRAITRDPDNERFVGETEGANSNPAEHIVTRIGSGRSSGEEFDGDLAAIVHFNRDLSESELLELEEYLYQRYLFPHEMIGYDAWIAGFEVSEERSGPADDASGDGVTNLEKFAFGLNPLEVSRAGLPVETLDTVEGERVLILSVTKNPQARGIEYIVESSTDLLDWDFDADHVEIIEETEEKIDARLVQPVDGERKQFLRARIVLERE